MIILKNPCIVILYGKDGFYRSNLQDTVNLAPDFFVFKNWVGTKHYKVPKSEVNSIEWEGKVIWQRKEKEGV